MATLSTPRVVPRAGFSLDPHGPIVLFRSLSAPVLPISRMLGIGCLNELN